MNMSKIDGRDKMDGSLNIYNKISGIVSARVNAMEKHARGAVRNALVTLLGDNIRKYDFDLGVSGLTDDDLQVALAGINEKTSVRKSKGVYYTPEDVCGYIVRNCAVMIAAGVDGVLVCSWSDAAERLSACPEYDVVSLLFDKTFFDPTCGTGEFLLSVFGVKLSILTDLYPTYGDADVYRISKTLYGNDIDEDSTDISKIRLFFGICRHIKNPEYYNPVAEALNADFSNTDYVVYDGRFDGMFDCIVGNPPYVEYGKYISGKSLPNDFGNVYADVIKNSVLSLKDDGILGLVVPLSYVSTSRMAAVREYVAENTSGQFILSFADRPDCLFGGVHQKLNVIMAKKGSGVHKLYTSDYRHWYKDERRDLFRGCRVKENRHAEDKFIPKIGNDVEESIYLKIHTDTKDNLFDKRVTDGKSIYVNMRGCFWIKAFSFNPGSKEYKAFNYATDYPFAYCALNSSLFWLYWTMTSDCWHLTAKEMKGFYFPDLPDERYEIFDALATKLENRLEQTKTYVGTKQVDYEYKHKECKGEIDEIDDMLADVYGLTDEETAYVRNYALKYRTGSGANDKND